MTQLLLVESHVGNLLVIVPPVVATLVDLIIFVDFWFYSFTSV